jgi:hypothetical protein
VARGIVPRLALLTARQLIMTAALLSTSMLLKKQPLLSV